MAWAAWEYGYGFVSLLLAVPTAAFLVRLFMIQHDCGHGAFFRHRLANDWVGRVIGVLTLTPYDAWKRSHSIHHGTSGNLDKRGIGDLQTLTVGEYRALTPFRRLGYRLYRNPRHPVRLRPDLHVRLAPSFPDRHQARQLARLDQPDGDQSRHRRGGGRRDVAGRLEDVPFDPGPHHPDRRLHRHLALLHPAPVRRHGVGPRTASGTCTRRRCAAVPITYCRAC